MLLSQWLKQLAQRWFPRGSNRRRRARRVPTPTRRLVRLRLEVLEDRLTPSTDMLVFTTPVQTLTTGQTSSVITVQLQDGNGHAVNAPVGGTIVHLSSTSATSEFLDSNGNPLANMPGGSGPSILIPEGQSQVSFEYADTNGGQNGGTPTLTATATGYTSATQQETVNLPASNVIHVTTTDDNGDNTNPTEGSLRAAINAANAAPSSTIVFDVTGTIDLGGTDLPTLNQSTNIYGPGADKLTISNGELATSPVTRTIEIDDLAFANAHTSDPNRGFVPAILANASNTILRRLEVAHNDQGIFHSFGNLTVDACNIYDNGAFAYSGPKETGAGLDAQSGNISVVNSSIHDNTGIGMAWANGNFFGGLPSGTISYSTIENNHDTGIVNAGNMTLRNVIVRGNQGAGSNVGFNMPGDPGGILNVFLNGAASLYVEDSTIANNSTSDPGTAAGIDSENGTTLKMVNSTVTGNINKNTNDNSSRADSGGIGIYGGSAAISFSTIADNTVSAQSNPLAGGGIYTASDLKTNIPTPGLDGGFTIVGGATTTLDDTIVAGNTGSSASNPDVSETFISKGYNLIGVVNATGNGFSSAKHDQTGAAGQPLDPKLGALGDNGGPTPTMALQTGSPAIGAGNPTNAPDTDQRGVTRPQQGAIDIGAFEATLPTSPTLFPSPAELPATTVGVSYSQTITASGGSGNKTVTGQFTSDADGLSFSQGTNSLTISGTPTTAGTVTFTVTATDANNATTTLHYSLTVNGPITFSPDPSTLPDPVVNTSYLTIIRVSGGTGDKLLGYNFTSGSNADGLSFIPQFNSLSISGKPTAAGTIRFDVFALDAVGALAMQSYTLNVDQIGKYPITLSPAALPSATVGVPYFQEIDAGNGTGDKTMTLTPAAGTTLPAWLNVNAFNVDRLFISGTPPAAGSVSFDVTATDTTGKSTTQSYTLTINTVSAPVITSNPTNSSVTAGQTATFTASASGSPLPTVQWQVNSGGGWVDISGATSTTLTLNNVTTDLSGNQYRAVFYNSLGDDAISDAATLTVTTGTTAPTITLQPTNQTVTAGQTATFTAAGSGDPMPGVQWQVSTDGGKTFSNVTGNATATTDTLTLSNVATAMSGWEYQAVFSNGVGNPATTSAATLTVNPTILLSPSGGSLTAGAVGVAYSQTITASDGTGNKTVSITSGSLPAGLTVTQGIDQLTISGKPTVSGNFSFTVTATDSLGVQTTQSYTLQINKHPLTLMPSGGSLAAGSVGKFYNQSITASGRGPLTVTYQLAPGSSIPQGLKFTVRGSKLTIRGTPLAAGAGTVTFTVTATDKFGDTITQSYTLTVNPAPPITLSPGTLPTGAVGKAYSQTITAGGGSGPLTVGYQLAPGSSVPQGLKFAVSGGKLTIRGTPKAVGTVTFSVTAKDKFGDGYTQSYTLTV